jgi:hypothetical protein
MEVENQEGQGPLWAVAPLMMMISITVSSRKGRAVVQVISCRPVTAEARVGARVNAYGICGGQSGTGTGFSPSSSVFLCQYHSTVALQTH